MKDLSLQSAVHCEIDSFNDGTITGWACNRLAPGEPAHFYVLVDGQQVAEVVCDRSRPDVAASGIAAEIVGYSVRLPLNLLDGQSHRIEFRDLRRMHMVIQSSCRPVTNPAASG